MYYIHTHKWYKHRVGICTEPVVLVQPATKEAHAQSWYNRRTGTTGLV